MAKFNGLKAGWTDSDIKKYLQQATYILDTAIISRLSYIGETFVVNARTKGNYRDVTGNLRASISWVVLKDAKRVAGASLRAGKAGSTTKALLQQLKSDYPNGYVLIVIAGMDYAAAVESRGKDVITGSSLIAKKDLQDAMSAIKNKVNGNNG